MTDATLLRPASAAKRLGVTRQRVFQLMASGVLPRIQIDGCPFVELGRVDAYARARRHSAPHWRN